MDPDIQNIMEGIFTNTSNFPYTGKGAQSAMIIIDPYTGKIRGLIGGLGKRLIFAVGTEPLNQTSTGFINQTAFGLPPAVDMGKITEVDTVTDEEITIGNDKWKPKNSYNDFLGDMTIKEAVAFGKHSCRKGIGYGQPYKLIQLPTKQIPHHNT